MIEYGRSDSRFVYKHRAARRKVLALESTLRSVRMQERVQRIPVLVRNRELLKPSGVRGAMTQRRIFSETDRGEEVSGGCSRIRIDREWEREREFPE